MTYPISNEAGRQKFWETGSSKTLDVIKLRVGKEARKYVLKEIT
jgi:hypothetical protein